MKLLKFNIKPSTTKKSITYLITLIIFGISILLVNTGMVGSQFKGLLIPIGIYIILTISLNLVVGVLGELSLGHAGFACVGAYVGSCFSLIAQNSFSSPLLRFILALLLGGIAAGVFGILIGIPVLRLRGDYLAIVTLAFGEIIKVLVRNLYICTDKNGIHFSLSNFTSSQVDMATKKDILKGAMGVSGTPQDSTLIITVIIIFITLFVIMNMIDSRSGRAFMAIRDNRIAAESVGINVTKFKLMAFSTSAFFAGVAGVLYSHNLYSIDPKKFDYNMSIMILVFVVLGGLGNISGSVIATVVLYALPEVLRQFKEYRMLIYALALIAIMLLNNNKHFNNFKQKISPKNIIAHFKKKGEVTE